MEKHVKIGLLWAMLVAFIGKAVPQTAPGVVDNYSGSTAIWLNPSSLSNSFVYDDISLPSIAFSFDNSFAYMPSHTILPSLSAVFANEPWTTFTGVQPDKKYYFKYNEGMHPCSLYQSLDVTAFSLMKSIGGVHAIGFSLRERFYTSVTKMPWEVPVLITETLEYEDMHHIRYSSEGMRVATMGWAEADIAYSTLAFDNGAFRIDVGSTGKLLMGMIGFSVNTNVLDYQVENKDSLYFYAMDGDIRMALPISNEYNFRGGSDIELEKPLVKGWGAGFDAGFTLVSKKESSVRRKPRTACEDAPTYYYWRLGVSVLDVGGIWYANNTAMLGLTGESVGVDLRRFNSVRSIDETLDLLGELFDDDASGMDTLDGFFMGLPTAMSMQFDVNLASNVYCNVSWIQPISRWLYECAVEREPMLSLAPRYETSHLGVAFPVTFYDYRYLTAGAFVRVGPVSFGTSDLFSLTGLSKTHAADFTVTLRMKLDRGDCLFHPLRDACGGYHRRRH